MSGPERSSVAIHSIDHFALEVPSLSDGVDFFRAFGLEVDAQPESALIRTAGARHVWAKLLKGSGKQMAYLALNTRREDFDALSDVISMSSRPVQPHPEALYRDGIWFHDPEGNLLQVRPGPKTTPHIATATERVTDSSVRKVLGGDSQETIRPRRLSHVLLFAADVASQIAFYCSVLGLRLSDRSGDIIAFLHGAHGSDHHLIAFAKSNARGWHHCSWDVPTIEAVGLGWRQMSRAGYSRGWGLGRHVLGSNYFYYVEDPWGSFCEYSADIDFIAEGQEWPAADHPAEDSLYLWGPDVPENFITNTDVR
jgi:catechol-2,3-dioxygenase